MGGGGNDTIIGLELKALSHWIAVRPYVYPKPEVRVYDPISTRAYEIPVKDYEDRKERLEERLEFLMEEAERLGAMRGG